MRLFIHLLSISFMLSIAVGLTSTYASPISESDELITAHTHYLDHDVSMDLLLSDFDYRVFDDSPVGTLRPQTFKVPLVGFVTIRGRDPPAITLFQTGRLTHQARFEPIHAAAEIYRFARDGLIHARQVS